MKAIELLLNEETILSEELNTGKRAKVLAGNLKKVMLEMKTQINNLNDFTQSQLDGELASKIIVAKSLAHYFAGNKLLKVDLAVNALRAEEKTIVNNYYAVKTQLLDQLRTIIKESAKEALVSSYDLFDNDFVKCESGHEILVYDNRNTNVLEALIKDLDETLVIEGNMDKIAGQEVDYDLTTLNRNIDLCNRKNTEMFGSKPAKLAKAESVISKLKEVGSKVVAFYTYKDALLDIGVSPKGIKDFENELTKAYIPLKKTLQKEFKIELEDICSIQVNEDQYATPELEDASSMSSTAFEENSSLNEDTPSAINSDNIADANTNDNTDTPSQESAPANPFTTQEVSDAPVSNPFLNNNDDSSQI